MKYNYHTHSQYCDGKSNMEEMVIKAIELGYTQLGFSSHAPLPFYTHWAIKPEKLTNYFTEIKYLQTKYQDKIKLVKGLEIDYLPRHPKRFSEFIKLGELDYSIGAIHFVDNFPNGEAFDIAGKPHLFHQGLKEIFNNDTKKFVERYFELIYQLIEQKPTIVAHIDFIKNQNQHQKLFNENNNWYRALMEKALKSIKTNNVILEINTRGFYKSRTTDFYPSERFFPIIKKLDIPVIISSDAHHITELNAGVNKAKNLVEDYKLNLLSGI